MDSSRISTLCVPNDLDTQEIPLVPVKMEITSIEDTGSSEGQRNKNQEKEGEYYDASDEPLSDEDNKEKKPSRKERRAHQRMKKAMLKLRNGVEVQVDLYLNTTIATKRFNGN